MLLRAHIRHVSLHQGRKMQLRRVLDKKRKRHESQRGLGLRKFFKPACIGRVVRRSEAADRPFGRSGGGHGKSVEIGLSIARSPGISGSTKHQRNDSARQ